MSWKYALLLVSKAKDPPMLEECHLLVELYDLKDGRGYTSFCEAHPASIEDLEHALEDIKRDGINTHLYETGTFTWSTKDPIPFSYNWEPHQEGT